MNGIESLIREIKNSSNSSQEKKVEDQLLTIEEASKFLHLTKATLYSKNSRNEIPGVCKRGKRLYFSKSRLIEWVKSGQLKSIDEIIEKANKHLNK